MDGESSCESDISESWSLIDINLNEEPVTVVEAYSSLQLDKTSPRDSKKVELNQEENIKLKDFPNKSKDDIENFDHKLNDFVSDSCLKNKKLIASIKEGLDEENSKRRESDEGSKNDSCDAESIEILDVDGNDRDTDIERFDISYIHESDFDRSYSDNEGSFYEENVDYESKKTCSAVIKRKRRKLSKHSNSSRDSLNSDCIFSSGKYSNKHSRERVKSNEESKVQPCESSGRPVYKHYRNNVANTVLSLSMGVIFAGVACIAIGHFLGVHDAGDTAVELMETLKKLQMENIILQSQLSHLNKAFITRDMISQLKQSSSEPHDRSLRARESELFATKTEKTEPNPAALPLPASEIPPSWNSIEWLSKLQNLVRTKGDRLSNANGFGINEIVTNIHDQLTYIKRKQKEDARLKHLKDSDAKISKILKKIIGKLTLSQDNIESLYQKLVKLKNKLSRNLSKIIVEENIEVMTKRERKVPITEKDLLSIQWKPRKKETNPDENSFRKKVVVYKFPQPEKYYVEERIVKFGEDDNSTADENLTNPLNKEISYKDELVRTFKKPEELSVCERKKNIEHENERKCQAESARSKEKKMENNSKKEKIKVEKRLKRKLSKSQNSEKEPGRNKKKRDKVSDLKETRTKYNLKKVREAFNETKNQKKKHFKMEKLAHRIFKQKFVKKKNKKSKLKKVLLSSLFGKVPKESYQLKNFCYAPENHAERCFNLTGGWMFKWANGREESRRHQSLGDWQFDRAKGRKELRDEDFSLNWQFKRALARESNRNDDRWFYEKYRIRNHNRKGFFHEGYSWI